MPQFKRAIQKLGVVMPTGSRENDLDLIFNHYDEDGSGAIDYKELAKVIDMRNSDEADRIRKQMKHQT